MRDLEITSPCGKVRDMLMSSDLVYKRWDDQNPEGVTGTRSHSWQGQKLDVKLSLLKMMKMENKSVSATAYGWCGRGSGWIEVVGGRALRWWGTSVSWVQWWLHKSAQLIKSIELYTHSANVNFLPLILYISCDHWTLRKMQPWEETGQKECGTSTDHLCNFLWLYSDFKIKRNW